MVGYDEYSEEADVIYKAANLIPLGEEIDMGEEEVLGDDQEDEEVIRDEEEDVEEEQQNFIPIAILGRPNVWKSTLLNKLWQEDIAKVEDTLGTTLDYLTCDMVFNSIKYRLFDTAWIRKRWKIHWLEKVALSKTLSMLQYVNPVTIILIDISEWLVHRDLSIFERL